MQPTPSDPSAQLVELCHAEELRIAHHHRIGTRHIETAFDDAGRDQHIAVTFGEGDQRGIHLFGRHAAVRGQDRQFWQGFGDRRREGFQRGDPRHNDEALAIARLLAQ